MFTEKTPIPVQEYIIIAPFNALKKDRYLIAKKSQGSIYICSPLAPVLERDKWRFLRIVSSADTRSDRRYNRQTGSYHLAAVHDRFPWPPCPSSFRDAQSLDLPPRPGPRTKTHSSLDPNISFNKNDMSNNSGIR